MAYLVQMSSENGNDAYNDIIDLAYPFPLKHARMSRGERVAQFSAFAALSGHGEAIKETGRLTEDKIEIYEDTKSYLGQQLNLIQAHAGELPVIRITHFVPDSKKAGGKYVTSIGTVKKIDELERSVKMQDGTAIFIDDIYTIHGDLFQCLEDNNG